MTIIKGVTIKIYRARNPKKIRIQAKKPQALVFQSCRLWQEGRDSGFQELQQLNFKPVPYSNSI